MRLFRRGFSLIEVVLAISIVAFSLIAIVGLIPMGLQSMRESQNDQAVGTIANQLRGDLQQISFAGGAGSLSTLPNTTYYYTTEGIKTDINSSAGTIFYQAQFAVANAGVNGVAFTGTPQVPSNAATITVTLSYPYPSTAQKTSFSLFATRQTGL